MSRIAELLFPRNAPVAPSIPQKAPAPQAPSGQPPAALSQDEFVSMLRAALADQHDGFEAAGAQAGAGVQPAAPARSGPGAQRINQVLDRLDVEHNPRYRPSGTPHTSSRVTHCNEFAQDVMRQAGVPRGELPTGNANHMNQWLNQQGPSHGWRQVSAAEAQRLANQGQVTLASWRNPTGDHGHVAVVRPGSSNGVRIAQAGGHNYHDAPVSRGFGRHTPQYFVHDGPTQPGSTRAPREAGGTFEPPTAQRTQGSTGTTRRAPREAAGTFEPPTAQRTQGTTGTTSGRGLDLRSQLSSPNSPLSVAIGHAEGNRTVNGGHTRSYAGHTDPGNRAHNLGTFSYQARQNSSVQTPEQADQVQLARLRSQIPGYEAACRRAGVDANNPRLQAAYFNLWNQSPRMAGRFLDRMGRNLGNQPLSVENITRARVDACYDDRGRFTSTGLRNPQRAYRDQLRRENALEAVLQHDRAV